LRAGSTVALPDAEWIRSRHVVFFEGLHSLGSFDAFNVDQHRIHIERALDFDSLALKGLGPFLIVQRIDVSGSLLEDELPSVLDNASGKDRGLGLFLFRLVLCLRHKRAGLPCGERRRPARNAHRCDHAKGKANVQQTPLESQTCTSWGNCSYPGRVSNEVAKSLVIETARDSGRAPSEAGKNYLALRKKMPGGPRD